MASRRAVNGCLNRTLEGAADHQEEQGRAHPKEQNWPGSQSARHTEGRYDQDRRGSGQPKHMELIWSAQNHASTEEAYARDESLDNAAGGVRSIGMLLQGELTDGENQQARRQGDQTQGAQSDGLVVQVAVDADDGSNQH